MRWAGQPKRPMQVFEARRTSHEGTFKVQVFTIYLDIWTFGKGLGGPSVCGFSKHLAILLYADVMYRPDHPAMSAICLGRSWATDPAE